MNKINKIWTLGILAIVLVAYSAVAIAAPTVTTPTIPKDIQDRIHSNVNPAPLEKNKVLVSGMANYILSNREKFKRILPNRRSGSDGPSPIAIKFNTETNNLPQNEQSVTTWTKPSGAVLVVGGANDYRGFYGLLSGLSGYYVSNNNGTSLLRDGGLPPLISTADDNGDVSFTAMSGGDPALDTFKADGTTYYVSLYEDFVGGTFTNAVGLGQATPADLQNTVLPDSSVWGIGKVRADSGSSVQFNDKPWLAVDNSGVTGNIYVTWTAFNFGLGTSKIWMSKCDSTLTCTTIHDDSSPVSDIQTQTQMSKVSVDSAGRVVVTWLEYNFTNNPNPPYYSINAWYRVYSAGGASALTAPTLIQTMYKPVDSSFAMQGNFFRAPENVWSEVAKSGVTPRLFAAYQECGGSYLYDIPFFFYADSCSNADTYVRYIDNYQTGSPSISSSIPLEQASNKHSFFPTMSVNQPAGKLDIAWYQTDTTKHDYYLAQQQRSITTPATITIPTSTLFASDPYADVYFGGGFIGDYFQVRTQPGSTNRVFAHYTANTRFAAPASFTDIFGFGPFKLGGNQDDNFLNVKTY